MTEEKAQEVAADLAHYNSLLEELLTCEDDLDGERRRSRRWWRRPAFWIPVACITFTAGLFVGTANK